MRVSTIPLKHKIISVYLNKAISSDRKIATNCDSGIQPTHLG